MEKLVDCLQELVNSQKPLNSERLKEQQAYYKRLSKKGVAQKQTYNLKPISMI